MNSRTLFHLRLFGSPSISALDGVVVSGRAIQRHRIALLALLAVAPGQCVTRDRLIGCLWPESDPEHARQLLNQAVYQLRKALGEAVLLSAGDELRLNGEVLEVDVLLFEAALERGDPAAAAALYGGPLLDGLFLSAAEEFERWLDRERTRLGSAYARALESLAETADREGRHARAAEWWRARAAHDPYDSRVALRLMQALEAAGNPAAALHHATAHGHLLEEEIGIRPPAELAAFVEHLREAGTDVPEGSGAQGRGSEPARSRSRPVPSPPPAAALRRMPAPAGEATTLAPSRAGTLRDRGWWILRIGATAVVAAAVGAAAWYAGRDRDERWLLRDALPRIEAALAVADWESAFALVQEAEQRVPGSRDVAELWPRLSWHVKLESEPAGAAVFRQAYGARDDSWELLGRTPIADVRIPYGLSRIRLELNGHRPLLRTLGGAHINWHELMPGNPDHLLVGPERYRLDTERSLPADMVRVPGWSMGLAGERVEVADFFIGRYEVTNAEFKEFVDAGGYRRPELWDPVVIGGHTLGFEAAMRLFLDRSGRAGPGTWQAGDYPEGEENHPVSGVSWYEAAAYARFVGRELPTAHHWEQALANSMFPWLLPASNFGGRAPRPVGEGRAMSFVETYDLAGNVREWTASDIGSERIILGGSFEDPYYVAGSIDASAPPENRSEGNGFRVALTGDAPAVASRLRTPVEKQTTAPATAETPPVSDEVYAAYGRFFDYDRRPLDPATERVDSTRLWIRQRVRLDAGYGGERMVLNLYLPRTGTRPLQAVVYWPGWDTFWLDDADEYFAKQLDFIVKSGRAVAFPVFQGTFERRVDGARQRPDFNTADYRDNTIATVKELRRTVDYLVTRTDIDSTALALFGYSWGGVNGPTALAQEPRLRVGVISIGLLPPMDATPEVDPVNALPRVHVPMLVFSGEFDAMVPSANARRYFSLIGAAPDRKRHVMAIGGHFVPRDLLIRETLDWLDRYLGTDARP